MDEVWKPAPGFAKHEISNHGRLRSTSAVRQRPRVLTPHPDGGGYLQTMIGKRNAKIHRLVAIAFLPGSGDEVNHRDGNKKNNHVGNLEWCNRNHNMQHAYRLGLKVPARNQPHRIAVIAECVKTGKLHGFNSIRDAARLLLGDVKKQPPITHCLNGKLKTAYGYRWFKGVET